jgi:mRNA-degrading endonuclease RelE of RelBE toxin-antitoxin system
MIEWATPEKVQLRGESPPLSVSAKATSYRIWRIDRSQKAPGCERRGERCARCDADRWLIVQPAMTIIKVIMEPKQSYKLIYAPAVRQQLQAIEAKYYSLIRKTIEEQLSHEPDVETRNRKPLSRPVLFEATWEIRFSPDNRFRVFYDINPEQRTVFILAIGVKLGNQLFIGNQEILL